MNQLIEHLPAIYREGIPIQGQRLPSHFLGVFLRAFERVLLDGEEEFTSLDEQVDRIPLLFDPQSTPEGFLNWLAGWIALSFQAGLNPQKRRRLLARMASLYRIRGTRAYLEEVLRLQLDALPSVSDTDLPGFQIRAHSTVGDDTYLGGGPPFLFQVTLAFTHQDRAFVEQQSRLARDVIEREKPAHAWYKVTVIFPRLRVGIHSTIGVDTVLAPPN
ncbi:MAG: hypothetical protein JOY62_01135 [Acidobacteriaceae bacterium]|nr:hypothetical protein [Acidobacteriaceae bacterium]MBV9778549.1 hypothetical protein [Acidobacteriaceae bacterium]